MKIFSKIIFFSSLSLSVHVQAQITIPDQDDRLWFDKPAEIWTEGLPLGNGYMGAMVFGGVNRERLQLNEVTLYSGDPKGTFKNIDIRKHYPKIDSLMKAERYAEAQTAIHEEWLGRNHQSYQPMSDFWMDFKHEGSPSKYKRELILSDATAKVSYEVNGTLFTREYFASYPDHAIIVRLTSSGKDLIHTKLYFSTPHDKLAKYRVHQHQLILGSKAPGFVVRRTLPQIIKEGDEFKYPEIFDKDGTQLPNAAQVLYGADADGLGMSFDSRVKVLGNNGKTAYGTDYIEISDATEALLVITAATSYNGFEKSPATEGRDAAALASGCIQKLTGKTYEMLRKTHLTDYRRLFDRVRIQLAPRSEQSRNTTDQRVLLFANQKDPSLANLYFQFGRYLMIAGSRAGGQPLNLQGIWNDLVIPPWNGAYTTNINAQMNYWPSEITNLQECQEPFFRAVKELAVNGEKTARDMYGNEGWVAHHNMDIWRHAEPIDMCNCSFWPMAAGWFVSHFWEHYLYTGSKEFLKKETWPLLKGAVLFYKDWLVEGEKGYLVTPMGHSPEHAFVYGNNERSTLSPGPTMDMAIIRESFERYLEAARILSIEEPLTQEIKTKLDKLIPYQVGKYGQLQEWMKDFEDGEKEHRHISHLYPFYPGNQINEHSAPELVSAVGKTMERRGDQATGWSLAWKINVQARLGNGEKAYTLLTNLFTLIKDNDRKHFNGKTYPNLFDACPPFQIDGNLGTTAGIAEMLVQSHAGEIQLLPALPKEWKTGKVTGLRVRGGFVIDMEWQDGHVKNVAVKSELGGNCRIRSAAKMTIANSRQITDYAQNPNLLFGFINPGKILVNSNGQVSRPVTGNSFVYDFDTRASQIYHFRSAE